MKRASGEDAIEDSKRQRTCPTTQIGRVTPFSELKSSRLALLLTQRKASDLEAPDGLHQPKLSEAIPSAAASACDKGHQQPVGLQQAINFGGSKPVAHSAEKVMPQPQCTSAVITLRDPDTFVASRGSVLKERKTSVEQLYSMYQDMFWALGEELDMKRQMLIESKQPLWEDAEASVASLETFENEMRSPTTPPLDLWHRLQLAEQRLCSDKAYLPVAAAATPTSTSPLAAYAVPASSPFSDRPETAALEGSQQLRSLAAVSRNQLNVSCSEQALQGGQHITSAVTAGSDGDCARLYDLQQLGRLECSSSSGAAAEMENTEVLATLQGRRIKFGLCVSSIILGRCSPSTPDVDVDLAAEVFGGRAAATKVSRRAACLALRSDGVWHIRVVGRAALHVNGVMIFPNQEIEVPHLSIIEADQVQLLFMSNPHAVRRAMNATRNQARAVIES